ncbi:hypothetical protein [Microcystis phage Mae-JY02]
MIRENLFLIRSYAVICAALGLDCLRVAVTGGIPMPLATHGTAIHTIPAELWSGIALAQGVAVLVLAGTERHWALGLAALFGGVLNIALGVYSASAEFGFVQSRVAFGAGLLHLVIAALAFHDARRCSLLRRMRRMEARVEARRK